MAAVVDRSHGLCPDHTHRGWPPRYGMGHRDRRPVRFGRKPASALVRAIGAASCVCRPIGLRYGPGHDVGRELGQQLRQVHRPGQRRDR